MLYLSFVNDLSHNFASPFGNEGSSNTRTDAWWKLKLFTIMTPTPMTSTSNLLTVVTNALPSLSGSGITYNQGRNIFLSTGYTSAAGNTYYQGIRLSDRLIINYDLGDGYAYTFLNGLKLYCFDNREKKLIGSEIYNCCVFSERYARQEVIRLLSNYLRSQAKILGANIEEHQLMDFSEHLADEAIVQRSRLLT